MATTTYGHDIDNDYEHEEGGGWKKANDGDEADKMRGECGKRKMRGHNVRCEEQRGGGGQQQRHQLRIIIVWGLTTLAKF